MQWVAATEDYGVKARPRVAKQPAANTTARSFLAVSEGATVVTWLFKTYARLFH